MNFTLRTEKDSHELPGSQIWCNDIIFPGEFNPNNVRPWIIGHQFGALCVVWAECEQDALDNMVDLCPCEIVNCFVLDDEELEKPEETVREGIAYLGNSGEPCDISTLWIAPVLLHITKDAELMIALAEARGACDDTLDDNRTAEERR